MANLRVQMDLYHAQVVEGDLDRRRSATGCRTSATSRSPACRHATSPDIGEVNYDYLFKLLDELKYDGWIGCEYRPAQTTAAGLGWLYKLIDRRPAAAE